MELYSSKFPGSGSPVFFLKATSLRNCQVFSRQFLSETVEIISPKLMKLVCLFVLLSLTILINCQPYKRMDIAETSKELADTCYFEDTPAFNIEVALFEDF